MRTSDELIKSVIEYKNGNAEAFNSIYEQSYAYLHTCVIHIVKNEDVAQDMIQDTYMEIIKNIGSLEKEESFLSWAAMIANRKCFVRIKKNQELLVSDSDEEQSDYFENIADDEAFIPENILDNQAKVDIIKGIIDELSDVQRTCVIGFYYNEQKQDEIAEELGIPVNTVKSHLNRAKAKIKESVGETEKKQGIKLYSIAPFMLLFFTKEVKACELVPMSEQLSEASMVSANAEGIGKSTLGTKSDAGVSKKIAGWKIGAIAGVVVIAGIAGVVATTSKDKANTEIEETAEPVEQVEKAVEEKDIVDDTPADVVEEIEPEVELSDLEKAGLSYDVVYDGPLIITDAQNGVAIAYDEETMLGGMISLDGQILVPIEYSSASGKFSDDGTTYFTDSSEVRHIFNSDGAELYNTSNQIIGIGNGYVTEVSDDVGYIKSFSGDIIYSCSFDMYGWNGGMVSFSEGYAYAWNDNNNAIDKIDMSGNVSELIELHTEHRPDHSNDETGYTNGMPRFISQTASMSTNIFSFPYGMSNEGLVTYRGVSYIEDWMDLHSIYDTGLNLVGEFRVCDLLDSRGFSGDYKYAVIRAFDNHGYVYNYGTKMVVKGRDDSKTRYYIVEVSGCNNGDVPPVLFEADEIITSKEKYWLYNTGDRWGYVDHEGNIVGEYEDASEFDNGIAMIIQDGKAFFIDEEFNLLGDGIEADRVSNCGDLFAVTQGEKVVYIGRTFLTNNETLSENDENSVPKINIDRSKFDSDKTMYSSGEIYDIDASYNYYTNADEFWNNYYDHETWKKYPMVSAGTILHSENNIPYSVQIMIGDGQNENDKYTYEAMLDDIVVGDQMFLQDAPENYLDWGLTKDEINSYQWYICCGDWVDSPCIILICEGK